MGTIINKVLNGCADKEMCIVCVPPFISSGKQLGKLSILFLITRLPLSNSVQSFCLLKLIEQTSCLPLKTRYWQGAATNTVRAAEVHAQLRCHGVPTFFFPFLSKNRSELQKRHYSSFFSLFLFCMCKVCCINVRWRDVFLFLDIFLWAREK